MKYTLAVFLLGAAVIALSCVEAMRDHERHGSKENEILPSESHRTRRQSDDSDEQHDHKRHHRHHHHHHDENDDNTNHTGGFEFGGRMPNMDEVVDAFGSAMEKGQEILNQSMSNFQNMFHRN